MEQEQWIPIPNHPNYEVSNFGRVRNTKTNYILQPSPIKVHPKSLTHYSYPSIRHVSGNFHRQYVHRLVATAFLPNPLKLPYINHKDLDGLNNHYTNLEWCTSSHNSRHARALRVYATPFCLQWHQPVSSGSINFDKIRGRYQAQIQIFGRQRHVGYYDTVEAAQEGLKRRKLLEEQRL